MRDHYDGPTAHTVLRRAELFWATVSVVALIAGVITLLVLL